MKRVPGAIFIVDPHREHIAVTEANKLEIPVVGTGDTNVDPDELDYIIPANDDAIRSIRLLCQLVADAAIEGARERAARATAEPEAPEPQALEEPEFDESAAADLVAQLAAGGTLSFDPDLEDDDLPPGSRPVELAAAAAAAPGPRRSRRPTDAERADAVPPAWSRPRPGPAAHETKRALRADDTGAPLRWQSAGLSRSFASAVA
jgi:hypothetical protein